MVGSTLQTSPCPLEPDGSRLPEGLGRTSISEWRLTPLHYQMQGFSYLISDWRARSTGPFGCLVQLPLHPGPIRFGSPDWRTGRPATQAWLQSTLPLPEI